MEALFVFFNSWDCLGLSCLSLIKEIEDNIQYTGHSIIQVQQFKPIFTVTLTYDCNDFPKYSGTKPSIMITNFTLHLFVMHIVQIGNVHNNTSFII